MFVVFVSCIKFVLCSEFFHILNKYSLSYQFCIRNLVFLFLKEAPKILWVSGPKKNLDTALCKSKLLCKMKRTEIMGPA